MLNIKVIIADRSYPLKVKPEEEEGVRSAARMINGKIEELSQKYGASDKQDYLAMACLTYVVDSFRREGTGNTGEIEKKLGELDAIISSFT